MSKYLLYCVISTRTSFLNINQRAKHIICAGEQHIICKDNILIILKSTNMLPFTSKANQKQTYSEEKLYNTVISSSKIVFFLNVY